MKHSTKEEREQRIEQLRGEIAEGVEKLRDSDEWKRYLDYVGRFHRYSWNNILLIMHQSHGTASLVAGFSQWKERGRMVRKGEHGIKILGYSSRLVRDEDGNPKTDEDGNPIHRVWYPIVTVFDVKQTTPIEPDTDPIEKVHAKPLEGEDEHNITERMREWLESQGWTVSVEPLADNELKGYSVMDGTRRIVLNQANSPAQNAKTILHETAHTLLHQTLPDGEYGKHRGIYETEAESVAYIAAKWAGLDTKQYSISYVNGWSGGSAELIKQTAEHVRQAADTIITALETSRDQ